MHYHPAQTRSARRRRAVPRLALLLAAACLCAIGAATAGARTTARHQPTAGAARACHAAHVRRVGRTAARRAARCARRTAPTQRGHRLSAGSGRGAGSAAGGRSRRISRVLPKPPSRLRKAPVPRGGGAGAGSGGAGGGTGRELEAEIYEEPEEEPAGEASNEPSELTTPNAVQAEESSEADEPAAEPMSGVADEGSEELAEETFEGVRLNEGELPQDEGETTIDPSDRRFLTYVPFGTVSFWVQPWRAYLDTWPASRLLNAVGINFSGFGTQAPAIAQLLQDSGFRLARKGIPWDAMSYANPTLFRREERIRGALALLHAHIWCWKRWLLRRSARPAYC
jgi:hypothetical protein